MATKVKSEGFGFMPSESEHHFLVTISSRKKDDVYITEHFTWDEDSPQRQLSFALGLEDNKLRVILPRFKWDKIADEVKAHFNQRLRGAGIKSGQWKNGENPIGRLLGKELVLLCWAIEDADPGVIPVAIKNWLGLAPEERWWLFTMTNAATGHALTGRNKGWRKAVRFALTENPVSGDLIPSQRLETPLFTLNETAGNWEGSKTLEPSPRTKTSRKTYQTQPLQNRN